MTRRPLLTTAAALCATLTLAACNASPEAGRPNTAPPAPTSPTPTAPSTPDYTAEEQAAITAAIARYRAARTAIDTAMANAAKSSRTPLEAAGLGGSWLITVIGDVRDLRESGWYQSGSARLSKLTVKSVSLEKAQPEVNLTACVDFSQTVLRFQSTKKPVPIGASSGTRHTFAAKLVFAPPVGSTTKKWFVIEEKGGGEC